jgi:hypothetical protein
MLQSIFITITFLSFILFYCGTGKDKKVLLFSLLWLLITGVAATGGYFENTSARPPRFLFVLIFALLLSIFCFKKVRYNKLESRFLIALHVLRLPIELVLYQLFLQKQVPVQMTFIGWNFDIVMGLSAIGMLAYYLSGKRINKYLFLAWNLSGLLLLTIIVVIAILSSPLPLQQIAFEQPNIAVLQFPYVYLPAYIVPVVYSSHFLLIKPDQKN